MKYFKLDKDKREIIIDKYKKYNVNVDILNLIIDLKCENDRLNNKIKEQNLLLIEFQDMEQRVKQLENIRKEAIEYIKNNSYFESNIVKTMIFEDYSSGLLNILNKGSE